MEKRWDNALYDVLLSFIADLRHFSILQQVNKLWNKTIQHGRQFINVLCKQKNTFKCWSGRVRQLEKIYILEKEVSAFLRVVLTYKDAFTHLRYIVVHYSFLTDIDPTILKNCPKLILDLDSAGQVNKWTWRGKVEILEKFTRAADRKKRILAFQVLESALIEHGNEKKWDTKDQQQLKYLFHELCSLSQQKILLKKLMLVNPQYTTLLTFSNPKSMQNENYREICCVVLFSFLQTKVKQLIQIATENKDNSLSDYELLFCATETIIDFIFSHESFEIQKKIIVYLLKLGCSLPYLETCHLLYFLLHEKEGPARLKCYFESLPESCMFAKIYCRKETCCYAGFKSYFEFLRNWIKQSSFIYKIPLEKCLSSFLFSLSTNLEKNGKLFIYDPSILTRAQLNYETYKNELEKEEKKIFEKKIISSYWLNNIDPHPQKIEIHFCRFKEVKDLKKWWQETYGKREILFIYDGEILNETINLFQTIYPQENIYVVFKP